MGQDYISIEEAAEQSGLHVETLKRLLRAGVLAGYKSVERGRRRWFVSARSLKGYTDPLTGFLLDLPGPKLYLRRRDDGAEGND